MNEENVIHLEVDEKVAEEIQYLTLKDDPFIPEEVGFTQTAQHDENGAIVARIFSRDGFNIARPVDLDTKHWVVMAPDGTTNTVLLPNAFYAVIILQACGMPITHSMYFEGDPEKLKAEGEKKAMKEFAEEVIENESQDEEE